MKKIAIILAAAISISFSGASRAETLEEDGAITGTTGAGDRDLIYQESVEPEAIEGVGSAARRPGRRQDRGLKGRWYLGGGPQIAIADFKSDLAGQDWDNSWGFALKGGYFVTEIFALEFSFRYLNKFEYRDSQSLYDWWLFHHDYNYKAEISGYDFSLSGKLYLPLSGSFKPYGVGGMGYARGEIKTELTDIIDWGWLSEVTTTTERRSGLLGRIGAGADLFLDEHFALEAEATYNMGFGDIEELCFVSLGINALVLF